MMTGPRRPAVVEPPEPSPGLDTRGLNNPPLRSTKYGANARPIRGECAVIALRELSFAVDRRRVAGRSKSHETDNLFDRQCRHEFAGPH